jgi:D-cysteine desulfhydrase family pyridoxal phosphate-dependent enzyme
MKLAKLPRFSLAQLPTPLMPAKNLSAALGGPEILIKRDDLTGLALGGNKTRKLEYLIADAQANGATHVITMGAVQSNHCRQTAAACRLAGLNCVLVMNASTEDPAVQGNFLLDHILGAEPHIISDKTDRMSRAEHIAEELKAQGHVPYIIPTGGSNPIGASSYVAASYELMQQSIDQGVVLSRLYVAAGGPGGTHAGLCLGQKMTNASWKVQGISIENRGDRLKQTNSKLANETAEYLGTDVRLTEDDIHVDDRYTGPGYGIATDECLEAIRLLARTEGIFLDPVYTGKTMAGLIDHIRTGVISPDETVVFLHTGGAPALFADPELILSAVRSRSD